MVSRAELDDERAFLLRSIEDLDRERAAGDLSDFDYALLRDRYVARAADVLRALEDAHEAPSVSGTTVSDDSDVVLPTTDDMARRTRPRRQRRVLLAGGVGAVVAAVCGVVVSQTGTRLPGETSSGSVTVAGTEQARRTVAQAETLQSEGDDAGALRLYRQVLATDPTQADALAQSGWLEFEAGVQARNGAVLARAQQTEEQAVRVAPGSYAAHLYLGSMLLAENDAVGAQQQFRRFLADHPPAAQVQVAAPFIDRAFAATGQAPPALGGAASAPPG